MIAALLLLVPLLQSIGNHLSEPILFWWAGCGKFLANIFMRGRDELRDVSANELKRERLRLELATAAMRRDWAKLESDRNGVAGIGIYCVISYSAASPSATRNLARAGESAPRSGLAFDVRIGSRGDVGWHAPQDGAIQTGRSPRRNRVDRSP